MKESIDDRERGMLLNATADVDIDAVLGKASLPEREAREEFNKIMVALFKDVDAQLTEMQEKGAGGVRVAWQNIPDRNHNPEGRFGFVYMTGKKQP